MKRKAIMLACAAVVAACLLALALLVGPYLKAEHEIDSLRSACIVQADGAEHPDVDWEQLQQVNPAVCAWVVVPGTNVSYPIVASPSSEPDYYIDHSIYQEHSVEGTPYLDVHCAADWSSPLSAVYGHHLINQGMFSAFGSYSNEDFFAEHHTILLLTPQENLTLDVVAANIVDADYERLTLQFEDRAAFLAEWQRLVRESEVVAEDCPQEPEQAFCFSTCTYESSNARTLTLAVVRS